jgi:hypothetical protein
MNYLFTAILVFVVVGTVLVTTQTQSHQTIVGSAEAQAVTTANGLLNQASLATGVNLVAQASANPTTPLTAGYTWTSGTATVTSAIEGDTKTGSGTLTASNIETTSNERRVAVNFAVTATTASPPIYHRILYRLYTAAGGGYQILSDVVIGATTDASINAAPDIGGCAGTGLGCDPNQVQAADPTTILAQHACNAGYGSGTCPGPDINASVYTSAAWNNSQLSQVP